MMVSKQVILEENLFGIIWKTIEEADSKNLY